MAVAATTERELKLDVEPDFALPELGDAIEERLFVSTYFDTPERRLARTAITPRRRGENGPSLWQPKPPQGAARLELEVPGGPTPPAELLALLAGLLRREEL